MSKDGDWILVESDEAMAHVLATLEARGARYRFGAPLDVRWMSGGWSAHLEFAQGGLRVRTDFVTRPPRLSPEDLAALWLEAHGQDMPYLDLRRLAELKKTNRERDWAVIGELARRMTDPRVQLLYARSARDILVLARTHPDLVAELSRERPLLARTGDGQAALEAALDAERRASMHADEDRLRATSKPPGRGTRPGPAWSLRSSGCPSARRTPSSWSVLASCCRYVSRTRAGGREIRDEFLSEEDLDLANLSEEELLAWWDEWLQLAQATNEADQNVYAHGTFVLFSEE